MTKYKCESHKLDLICRGCVKAWIARHDKMLEFIKKISNEEIAFESVEAEKLLKEIGEAE